MHWIEKIMSASMIPRLSILSHCTRIGCDTSLIGHGINVRTLIQSLKQHGRKKLGIHSLFPSLFHYSFNGSLLFNDLISE